ncbi:MAG: hypothetical protein L0227_06270, partial [Chloroflexi bacterium]|nr:hypothetical protein [Chloroflexota bacterium]
EECQRYDDKYVDALAMVFCPAPSAEDLAVFFVLFPDATTMTNRYDSLMSGTVVAQRTETGCFDLVESNSTWVYGQGPTAGVLGCYTRTDGAVSGVQYLWTHDELTVMGHWLSPSFQEGLDYFIAWANGVNE